MLDLLQKIANDGGIFVYGIFGLLVVGLLIAVERYLVLHRANIDTFALLSGLMRQLKNNDIKVAVANCDAKTGPVGEIFRTAIEHWGDGELGLRNAVEEAAHLVIFRLEKRMKILLAIVSGAPLLGLLGTICKIMAMFDKMNSNGGQFIGTQPLAGDISGALICAACGLAVALIIYALYVLLTEKLDNLIHEMEKGAAEISYFLIVNPPSNNSSKQ